MTQKLFLKGPSSVLEYIFDWTDWLQTGDLISAHTITVAEGITKDSSSENQGIVTVWLSGGASGSTYPMSCQIETSMGRKEKFTVDVMVVER